MYFISCVLCWIIGLLFIFILPYILPTQLLGCRSCNKRLSMSFLCCAELNDKRFELSTNAAQDGSYISNEQQDFSDSVNRSEIASRYTSGCREYYDGIAASYPWGIDRAGGDVACRSGAPDESQFPVRNPLTGACLWAKKRGKSKTGSSFNVLR